MNTEIHQFVENQYIENFGTPSSSVRMQGGVDPRFPELLDIYFWDADEKNPLTTIATNGISQLPMTGKDHRCELHLYIAGSLTNEELNPLVEFIANFSLNPFSTESAFELFQSFGLTGSIPSFPSCPAIWLSGPFSEDGWEVMMYPEFPIHIYNLVPLKPEEHAILTSNPESGPQKLVEYLKNEDIQIFERR